MPDVLAADLNRTGLHSLEAPDSFETGGSFVVELRNHGEATHVHLNLDDALSSVADVEATNYYVQTDDTRPVEIQVATLDADDRPIRGKLKIVTAYGSETHHVDVTLDRTREKQPVEVDPDLSKPGANRQESTPVTSSLTSLAALPAFVLGGVALILAVGSVLAPERSVLFGVLAIVAGVLAAGYLMIQ